MKNKVDSTTWNDYLISALRAFRLKDLDLAEKRLDKAFAEGGEDIPYMYLLAGHIAHARGIVKEAEKSWKKVLEIEPDNGEAWNNLGVLYRRHGDDEKALAAFQEAEERAPDRPDIPYNIGNLYKSSGDFDKAVTYYNKAIEINPEYAPAFNNLGTLYETKKERGKALEVFRRGLSADSGDASLRFNMGLVYQEEERWDDAREAFDTALKKRPGWVPGLNNLGIVLQELGKEDEAARTFRSLLDIEPENVSALNNLGVAYDHLGRTDDARKCYKKALEEEPGYVKAALNLHDSYHVNQELNEALEEINKQITLNPQNPDIRVRMARTLMGLTRWTEAEQSLDHILERIPDHRETLRAKADLFLATLRPDEAERILKQLPHDPEIVRDLAKLNISTDRPEDAERLLGELISVNSDDADSRRLLADLLAEKNPEKALRLREEAAAAAPGDTEDMISLAELYSKIGRKDQALGKLDEAVNLLGSRNDAESLDEMGSVLGLYENAAAALENENEELFTRRTAQLSRKIQSAIGLREKEIRSRGQFSFEEIPLDEEDALSLLDLNAMEPVISINEEEETVFLEESTEDLEEAYTELTRQEKMKEIPGGFQLPSAPPAAPGSPGSPAAAAVPVDQPSSGPPVHIHLPAQSSVPQPPQVIYQDIRPVSQPVPPAPQEMPEVSVEEITEEEIPSFPEPPPEPEEDDSMELILEEKEENQPEEAIEEEEFFDKGNDDDPFFIPESDALSEDLPESSEPEIPDADLVFSDSDQPEQEMILEETDDELVLDEDFGLEEEEELEEVPEESVASDKMAEMFKYLSNLTDETVGEGRQQLIDEGVPLKLAGLHAKLTGEPNFREAAQKYDRRQRERHHVELNEETIKESLNAFQTLAESYPTQSVGESLSKKLGKIMSYVNRKKDS
ncbi:MAG: hypothetical protein DRZ90_02290 [Spirochaetes bacterium]|nr:MAG: hypothetical protein DRZ90_02290 [Spirochaetota bacterium]